MNKVIVIAGPTASGKTGVSIELAKKLKSEIVSADSVQVYKDMTIGSAKVREDEKQNIPHYMIDIKDPKDGYSMADFRREAQEHIDEILSRGITPIIAGGTGFYIQSVLRDLNLTEEDEDLEFREELEREAKEKGNEYVHNKLKEIDKVSYVKIHPNNLKRVIRALEFYKHNGRPISEHNIEEKEKDFKYDTCFIVLYFKDRDKLYERCDMRVDEMIKEGLVDEVKHLIDNGVPKDGVAMQAIGYKEVVEYLDGLITEEEMISKIKLNTRHLVKRQYTWFKNQIPDSIWIPVDELNLDKEKIVCEIEKYL